MNVCFYTVLAIQGWTSLISRNKFSMACLLALLADLWPFVPFVSAEASCWWGADAAARPCCQPDSHDAGHHGPEFVLLQCQTDDGEGPGPACTLKKLDYYDLGDNGWANEKWSRWSEEAGSTAVSSRTSLFSPDSHSHTRTLNFWYPSLTMRRDFRAAAKCFLYFLLRLWGICGGWLSRGCG